MVITFATIFLTEVINADDMYKMLKEFNNKIIELKSNYLVGQDEEIHDAIENVLLIYNNQLKFFDDYILKNKPLSTTKAPTKQIFSEELF